MTVTNMRSCTLFYQSIPCSLKQQYRITDVRYDILRLFGMARAGCWEEIRQLYATRKNIIPIEVGEMEGMILVVLLTDGCWKKGIQ